MFQCGFACTQKNLYLIMPPLSLPMGRNVFIGTQLLAIIVYVIVDVEEIIIGHYILTTINKLYSKVTFCIKFIVYNTHLGKFVVFLSKCITNEVTYINSRETMLQVITRGIIIRYYVYELLTRSNYWSILVGSH